MKNLFIALLLCALTFNCYARNHKPTIVLVHGALLTSSSWAPVQSYLQNKGYNVVTIDMPSRVNDGIQPKDATLAAAVEKICKVIEMQAEPVMLVGHSQAGALITQATNHCGSHIKGLVYVAAVVPAPGEKAFDLLSEQDNRNFDKAAPVDINAGVAKPDEKAPLKEFFMGDATEADAKRAISNMVPEPIILGDAPLSYDSNSFNKIPKFYIKTSKDLIISPETQSKFIQRQPMHSVITLNTSHSPFVSQPQLLGKKLAAINDML